MNNDLVIKLIKLANNNPNENEANLAARKVCQLLKDFNFTKTVADKLNIKPDPVKQQHDWTVYKYCIKCNKEINNFTGIFCTECYEWLMNESNKKINYEPIYTDEPIFYRTDLGNDFNFGASQKRKLKCFKCNQEKETRFQGNPTIWVCKECRL